MKRPSNADWNKRKSELDLGVGEIALLSQATNTILRARLDDGYPVREGGYGGWEDVDRPGQVSATVFRGTTSQRIQLPLILGAWPVPPTGSTCEQQIRDLEQLSRLPVGAKRGSKPPLIRVWGPAPHARRLYFVDDVVWDEVLVEGKKPVRAHVLVTLKRHVPVELAVRRAARRREDEPIRHVFKRGENLAEVVRRRLQLRGSKEVTAMLKRLRWGKGRNRGRRIRDPSKKVKPGDVILIPRVDKR